MARGLGPIEQDHYEDNPIAEIRSLKSEVAYLKRIVAGLSAGSGVTDHGLLSGLGDDDHSQYSLVSGTRAFAGTVSGVAPTASSHLATKGYVDGLVGGSDTYIQFNDSGNFGGDADLTWNKTSNTMTVSGTISCSLLGVGDGTQSNPSVYFSNDTDTGLYLSDVGKMELVVGGKWVCKFAGTLSDSGFIQTNWYSPSATALSGGRNFDFIVFGDSYSSSGSFRAAGVEFGANSGLSGGISIVAANSAGEIRFYTGGRSDSNERVTLGSDGSVSLNENLGASTTAVLLSVSASASHSANIQEWKNNAGTIMLAVQPDGDLQFGEGTDIVFGTATGTKIASSASQKLAFWNATPIVQPTTSVSEASFVENAGGTAINVDSTFGGYTIQQIVQALQDIGLLA